MRIEQVNKNVKIWLSAKDTYNWAHRPGSSWPCSQLTGKRLFAEFENGNLVDYTVNGRYAQNLSVTEFNAITEDFLESKQITL